MNRKEIQLLELLYRQGEWLTASFLSTSVHCSVRSIKNYVARLNSDYKDLILSSRSGYKINDKETAAKLLESTPVRPPQDARERKHHLLCKLLIGNGPIDMDELAAELCISYYTLQTLLNGLRLQLRNYDLTLKTKNNSVWINGIEKNKKNLLMDMLYEEVPDFYGDTSLLQTYLPHFDLNLLKSRIDSVLTESNFFIDDFSKLYFVLYIAITLEQRLAKPCAQSTHEDYSIPSDIKMITDRIADCIHEYTQVELSVTDKIDLSIFLMTRIKNESLDKAVNPETFHLMETVQNKVKQIFNINLSDINFLPMLISHLQSLEIRLGSNLVLKNPQLNSIRETYPYIYEIAVVVADVFSKETGYSVPEDEIGYLVLYIGVMLDYQKNLKEKIKAILFCPQYYTLHSSLVKKINSIFEDRMILTNVIVKLSDLSDCQNYDFIISTIPISVKNKTVKYVSHYMKTEEIIAINDEIDRQYRLKLKHSFQENLSALFRPEFFFLSKNFHNEKEAISFLSEQLYCKGYVDKDFERKVFERENICSSAFSHIALPHPLEMCAKKSAVSTLLIPGGMKWGKNTVNIVFLLAICEEDNLLFQDIFSFVTEFIADVKNMPALLSAKTYEEFLNTMISFFPE